MRAIWVLISVILTSTVVVLDSDPILQSTRRKGLEIGQDFLYSREIRLSTDGVLGFTEALENVILNHSNLEWRFFPDGVSTKIEEHKQVKSASLKSCADRIWGCFEIQIQEYQPRFLGLVGSTIWIGSKEGRLLDRISIGASGLSSEEGIYNESLANWFQLRRSPSTVRLLVSPRVEEGLAERSTERTEKLDSGKQESDAFSGWSVSYLGGQAIPSEVGSEDYTSNILDAINPVKVTGLALSGGSDRISQQRLLHVAQTVESFEKILERRVTTVDIGTQGELSLASGPEAIAIKLPAPGVNPVEGRRGELAGPKANQADVLPAKAGEAMYTTELQRAKIILSELGDRSAIIEEIDLSFDTVGVIRLRSSDVKAQQSRNQS